MEVMCNRWLNERDGRSGVWQPQREAPGSLAQPPRFTAILVFPEQHYAYSQQPPPASSIQDHSCHTLLPCLPTYMLQDNI